MNDAFRVRCGQTSGNRFSNFHRLGPAKLRTQAVPQSFSF
jgi:hypothetical protein